MRSIAYDRCVIAIGHDQASIVRKEALLFEEVGEVRRHGPKESVAIFEVVGPFAVAQQVRLGDLDLHDRERALGVDRHKVRAAAVRQRHFADSEEIVPAKQPGYAARDLARDRRQIRETQ